jgi:predicted HTH domain antitoxin
MQLTINLPDSLAKSLADSAQLIERRVLEDVVAEAMRSGKINRAEAAAYLGHESWHETEAFLSEHRIMLDYDSADLAHDIAVMDSFLSGK